MSLRLDCTSENTNWYATIIHLRRVQCIRTPPPFSVFLSREITVGASCLRPGTNEVFQSGSTPTGKNLLLEEQILFFKSRLLMRWDANMKMERVASPAGVPIHLKD